MAHRGNEQSSFASSSRRIIVDEKTIIIKLRRGLLLGEDVASSASEAASDSAIELTATAGFTRRGAETKLVLPGLAQQKQGDCAWAGVV